MVSKCHFPKKELVGKLKHSLGEIMEFTRPMIEREVKARWDKDNPDELYELREGRLPAFYTDLMKYIGAVIDGKLVGVVGIIDKGDYVILGGAKVLDKFQNQRVYSKLFKERDKQVKGRPKIMGFTSKNNLRKKGLFPLLTHPNIPKEIIQSFENRYGDGWGIAKNVCWDSLEKNYNSAWWEIICV